MNLLALRTEVLNHGFDPIVFSGRINQYLNDGYALICRRVNYYIDEAVLDFSTVSGTAMYPQPTDFARDRSLRQTDVQAELSQVGLRMIDRSAVATGAPRYYAIDGANVHLYPTPDGAYPLELRYWKLPALLVADTDSPNLPADWHHIVTTYAIARCYRGEDDMATAEQWMNNFMTELAEFSADQKFPTSDGPSRVADMWQGEGRLAGGGWSIFGSGWG